MPTANLCHCIYASAASPGLPDGEITRMLARARVKNRALGLTGMLLYCDGSFFQVLEGPQPAVESLYETIAADPRHVQITLIISEPIARRQFDGWTMGFSTLNQDELGEALDSNDFFTGGTSLASIGPGRARKLLLAFQKGRWRLSEEAMVSSAL